MIETTGLPSPKPQNAGNRPDREKQKIEFTNDNRRVTSCKPSRRYRVHEESIAD